MDVFPRIIRGIELDDPVNLGDVETSRRHVSTTQNALVSVNELEERVCSTLLLLLSVEIEARDVDVIEEARVVLGGCARGEEDDDLVKQQGSDR